MPVLGRERGVDAHEIRVRKEIEQLTALPTPGWLAMSDREVASRRT